MAKRKRAKKRAKAGSQTEASPLPPGVTLLHTLAGHSSAVMSVVFISQSGTLVSGGRDSTVKLWEADTGRLLRTLEGHTDEVNSVAFSPQGGTLATGSDDNTVKLWEADTGRLLRTLEGRTGCVYSVAFSPQGRVLASADNVSSLNLWDADTGRLLRTFEGHTESVYNVAFSPQGGTLASGNANNTVKLWDADTGRVLRTLEGHTSTVVSVAFSAQGKMLASGSVDNTVKLWNADTGRLLRTLEGHTGRVDAIAFSPDGRLLASKSGDGTIRLWNCQTWETVAVIPVPTHSHWWIPALTFNPTRTTRPLLAAASSEPGTPDDERCQLIQIWELDDDLLLGGDTGSRSRSSTTRTGSRGRTKAVTRGGKKSAGLRPSDDSHYRNAKVVLVGNSSVGKSGLGLVLAGRKFRATESTHGRHIWTMPATETNDDNETREAMLWDLAGQPGYRLVHQLHLSEVAVALVLFDARSETEPFVGVSYWARALDAARRDFPLKKFLVAARCDRNGPSVSQQRIEEMRQRFGFDGYFETSAKRGNSIEELQQALQKGIEWSLLAAVTRSSEFNIAKTFLMAKKRRGTIVEERSQLFADLKASVARKKQAAITQRVFDVCLQQLETTGLIRRLPFGDFVLLQPELLDDYCGWLTQAARKEPDGLGFLPELDASQGKFPMDEDRPLAQRKKEEQTLLLASVEESLSRGLALRTTDALRDRSLLVFPAELRDELPDYPGGYSLAARFRFNGPVRGVYASLVVRLIYSMEFEKEKLHRNAALFKARHDQGRICGLAVDYPDVEDDSLGRLTVFFDDNTRNAARSLFLRYVNSQLEKLAFKGSIERERIYDCAKCSRMIESTSVTAAIEAGNSRIFCPICGTPVPLDDLIEEVQQPDAGLADIDRQADTGQKLAGLKTTIAERRDDGDFDVFLCHNSKDKPAVRKLAEELSDMGLLGWIDEERLLPGDVIQEKLEEAIAEARSVVVCIGPSGLGRWQTVEYHTVYERFISETESNADKNRFRSDGAVRVIPVLLPGSKVKEIPSFLKRHGYTDLRKSTGENRRREILKLAEAVLAGRHETGQR
tara:strand:+ start:54659 stop:57862 length:3204 start_codon:yes stop_codon:yes gene_type:complete